ncbi:hypothetical protein IBTHAUMO2_690032 [Nitrosopumilaceae archaeon]|nr:hypothetical protein IBTHAUMO2_690032 [Nitrosopumilaceae archaeon]
MKCYPRLCLYSQARILDASWTRVYRHVGFRPVGRYGTTLPGGGPRWACVGPPGSGFGGLGKLYQDWYKAGYTRIGTSPGTTGADGLAGPAPPPRVPGAGTCWMSRIRLRGRAGKLYQD